MVAFIDLVAGIRKMTSKLTIIDSILNELRIAQRMTWMPPPPGPVSGLSLPPSLPVGNGRIINATEDMLDYIRGYADLYLDANPEIKPRYKIKEFLQIVSKAFGKVLSEIDLRLENEKLHFAVRDGVDDFIVKNIASRRIYLNLGCHLFEGKEAYPIQIGPVIFEDRDSWRKRMLEEGKISPITSRRLNAIWNGKHLKKRVSSRESIVESSILNAVGNCPAIVSITTDGLSTNNVQEKGALVARIAMTAISLLWQNPSQGLRWMNLLYDRRSPHRYTVLFDEEKWAGSNSEVPQFPSGRYIEDELLDRVRAYNESFEQIGLAIEGYVQPGKASSNRPNVMNALFLSLWWYHEACREPLDQIATTKFAASMDVLAKGGKAKGIINLIGMRLGPAANQPLFKGGQATQKVVDQIYNSARSRLIHGSSSNFSDDWAELRTKAEIIGRFLLLAFCDWLSDNPSSDDVAAFAQ